jgi:hypothetical protein
MKKPRNKKYQPRVPRIPLMAETRDHLALDLHMAVETLIGAPSREAFNELSKRFITMQKVVGAADYLEIAKRALLDIAARFERVGKFGVNAAEAEALRKASGSMDQALAGVTLDKLHQAAVQTTAWCIANNCAD